MNCHSCTLPNAPSLCGSCNTAAYCNKACQAKHWKTTHRLVCDVIVETRKFAPSPKFRRSEKETMPSWLPTKEFIDSVPPIPSSILRDLKSDYEIRHVKRMRKAKWLETIVENIFKNALIAKGADTASITTLLGMKTEFHSLFKEYFNAGVDSIYKKPEKMELLIILGIPGPWQIILIVLVVLLLFGGRKIPELMKGLGQGMKEFKKATKDESGAEEEDDAEKEKE